MKTENDLNEHRLGGIQEENVSFVDERTGRKNVNHSAEEDYRKDHRARY